MTTRFDLKTHGSGNTKPQTPNHKLQTPNPKRPNLKRLFLTFAVMKYTQNTLDKVEGVAEEAGYIVRYERGSFQSGFCILEDRKVVVLNKFLQLEGRINTMIDLIPQLRIEADALTPESKKWFSEIMGRHRASQQEQGSLGFSGSEGSEGSGGAPAEPKSETP